MSDLAGRLFDLEEVPHALKLKDRFVLPPFSILDSRGGWWQKRKAQWGDLGLRSAEGRDARMLAKSVKDNLITDPETGVTYLEGAPPGSVNYKILEVANGQSIFDPVLCELAYRWFCPPGGTVLDPFAGGSVRGLVAAFLGYSYVGIDLRPEQVEANELQAAEWLEKRQITEPPRWHVGDSCKPEGFAELPPADMVWSCPPYHDLEHYSEDPDDLSNMPWDSFTDAYFQANGNACSRLKPDRFAGFVVGEIRDKRGMFRNFLGLTVEAFQAAGLEFYNECIIVNPVGTLQLRTGKQFSVSRKIGKTHQNILLFVKGDPRKAAEACGEVRVITDYPTEEE